MKAIVLAAGKGTRLRPLTNDKPKCMVEIYGKPIIHWQLDVMADAGINDIVMVGGYKADKLKGLAGQLVVNADYARTNMVKTLFCAKEHMDSSQDLIISYGDIVYDKNVLKALIQCPAELCVAVDKEWKRLWSLRMDDPLSDAETMILDDERRITELGKKPDDYSQVQGQYIGLIKVRADKVGDFIDAWLNLDPDALYDRKPLKDMYMTSYIQHLIDSGWNVEAAMFSGGWLEVDTVEDLARYEKVLKQDSAEVSLGIPVAR